MGLLGAVLDVVWGFWKANGCARDDDSRGSTPWTNHGFSRVVEEQGRLGGNEEDYSDRQILELALGHQLVLYLSHWISQSAWITAS